MTVSALVQVECKSWQWNLCLLLFHYSLHQGTMLLIPFAGDFYPDVNSKQYHTNASSWEARIQSECIVPLRLSISIHLHSLWHPRNHPNTPAPYISQPTEHWSDSIIKRDKTIELWTNLFITLPHNDPRPNLKLCLSPT